MFHKIRYYDGDIEAYVCVGALEYHFGAVMAVLATAGFIGLLYGIYILAGCA